MNVLRARLFRPREIWKYRRIIGQLVCVAFIREKRARANSTTCSWTGGMQHWPRFSDAFKMKRSSLRSFRTKPPETTCCPSGRRDTSQRRLISSRELRISRISDLYFRRVTFQITATIMYPARREIVSLFRFFASL